MLSTFTPNDEVPVTVPWSVSPINTNYAPSSSVQQDTVGPNTLRLLMPDTGIVANFVRGLVVDGNIVQDVPAGGNRLQPADSHSQLRQIEEEEIGRSGATGELQGALAGHASLVAGAQPLAIQLQFTCDEKNIGAAALGKCMPSGIPRT